MVVRKWRCWLCLRCVSVSVSLSHPLIPPFLSCLPTHTTLRSSLTHWFTHSHSLSHSHSFTSSSVHIYSVNFLFLFFFFPDFFSLFFLFFPYFLQYRRVAASRAKVAQSLEMSKKIQSTSTSTSTFSHLHGESEKGKYPTDKINCNQN